MNYSLAILIVFDRCLTFLAFMLDDSSHSGPPSLRLQQEAAAVLAKMGPFSKAMWRLRRLLHQNVDNDLLREREEADVDKTGFAYLSYHSVLVLCEVHTHIQ